MDPRQHLFEATSNFLWRPGLDRGLGAQTGQDDIPQMRLKHYVLTDSVSPDFLAFNSRSATNADQAVLPAYPQPSESYLLIPPVYSPMIFNAVQSGVSTSKLGWCPPNVRHMMQTSAPGSPSTIPGEMARTSTDRNTSETGKCISTSETLQKTKRKPRKGPSLRPDALNKRWRTPRPLNPFIIYRRDKHQQVLAKNPGISNNEISKIIGNTWAAESESVKSIYRQRSEEAKRIHQAEHPEYRFAPRKHKPKRKKKTEDVAVASDTPGEGGADGYGAMLDNDWAH